METNNKKHTIVDITNNNIKTGEITYNRLDL